MVALTLCLAVLSTTTFSYAAPQQPYSAHKGFDPLKHLSAISPFYIPTQEPTPLPSPEGQTCTLKRVSLLIRHSSILGNDDEYEQSMGPFIEKIKEIKKNQSEEVIPRRGEWAFLLDWETPIVESKLENLSEAGKRDAKALGQYIRKQYNSLFPSKSRKGLKGKNKSKPTYKVWTASSTRDIETAQSFIKGAFPSHQSGDDGEGDGDVVQLIRVPNKAKDWDRSLTPHKACDTFEKESSLVPANKWLAVYAPRVIARIAESAPKLAERLVDQDVLGMQMLCGYETIAKGHSPFCDVFTKSEWLDFEYHQDIRFHYMLGFGQPLAPYLGAPWTRTALHLLGGKGTEDLNRGSESSSESRAGEVYGIVDEDEDEEDEEEGAWDAVKSWFKGKKGKKGKKEKEPGEDLPKPRLPPNATHTQLLHTSFTHRESPGFVATFLNLFNDTSISSPVAASVPPPLDYRPAPEERAWRTSHLVSFLGHVALERFHCSPSSSSASSSSSSSSASSESPSGSWMEQTLAGRIDTNHKGGAEKTGKNDYVRAVINGRQQIMGGCSDGLEGSCKWETFTRFVEERAGRWGNWAGVCEKNEGVDGQV